MRTRTTIVFNANERRLLEKAALARFVGKHGPISESDQEPKMISRLTHKGFEHNKRHLDDSLTALLRCKERCIAEQDPNLYLLPPKKNPQKQTIAEGGVPLFLDPLAAVKFIIDVRKQFVEDIDVALEIVRTAYARAGESPDDDPDFDPEEDEEGLTLR